MKTILQLSVLLFMAQICYGQSVPFQVNLSLYEVNPVNLESFAERGKYGGYDMDEDFSEIIVPLGETWEITSYNRFVTTYYFDGAGKHEFTDNYCYLTTSLKNENNGEEIFMAGAGDIATGKITANAGDKLIFHTFASTDSGYMIPSEATVKITSFIIKFTQATKISGLINTEVQINDSYNFLPQISNQLPSQVLQFSIKNCPEWAEFNVKDGSLTGTPVWTDEGVTKSIKISVTDNNDATAELPTFDLQVINPLEDYGDGRDGIFTGGTINRSRNYYFSEIKMQSGSVMNFYGEGAGIIKVAGDMIVESGAEINLRQDANPEAGIISFVGLERELNQKELNYGQGGYGQGYNASRGGQGGSSANGGHGQNFKSNGTGGTLLVFSPPNGAGGEYPGGDGKDAPGGYSVYELNGAWWTNWDYFNAGGGAAGKHGGSCENVGFIVKGDVLFQGTINGSGGNGEKGGKGGNGYEVGDNMFKRPAMAGAGGAGGAGGHAGNIYIFHRGDGSSTSATLNLFGGSGGMGGMGGYGNAHNEYYSPYTYHPATKAEDGTAGGNGDDGELKLRKIPIPKIECSQFVTFGEVNIGSESISILEIHNNGDRVLKIDSVKSGNAKFKVQLSGVGNYSIKLNPIEIQPNEKADINVKYSPEVEGPDSTVITIVNDDLDKPLIELTIKGIGKGPELLLVPGIINLAETSGIDSVKIKNAGGGELNWEIERNVNWLQFLSDSTGVGEQTVVFSYKKNNGITRKCFLSVTLSGNAESDSLEVIQAPGEHQYHFTPIWSSENPFAPMNVWISSATIDGHNLSEGDEIGIFDNDKCVGVKAITKTTQYPVNIPVGADDPLTNEIDGFTSGQPVDFRIWDYDLNNEITTVNSIVSTGKEKFESLSTLVTTLEVSTQCDPGWTEVIYPNSTTVYGEVRIDGAPAQQGDIVAAFVGSECRGVKNVEVDQSRAYVTLLINGDQQGEEVTFKIYSASECKEYLALGSLQTEPGATIGDVGDYFSIEYLPEDVQNLHLNNGWNLVSLFVLPGSNSPADIFNLAIQSGELVQVKSVDKSYDPNVPPFLNTLTEFIDGLGYWVKVRAEADIQVPGNRLGMLTIDLKEGWNLIGIPRKNSLGVGQIFNGIMQRLQQVKSINKSYDPNVPPFLNTLSTLDPGNGYWLNVDQATTLTFPNGITTQLAKITIDNKEEQTRWTPVIYSNSTTLYAQILGERKAGDGICAFVGSECRGVGKVVENDGDFYATLVINGDIEEEVGFKLYSYKEELEIESNVIVRSNPGEILEAEVEFKQHIITSDDENILPTETKLYAAYPNPFNPSTTIKYSLANESHIELRIYNILGKLIKKLVSATQGAGNYKVTWNGDNDNNKKVVGGIYLYSIELDNRFFETHKLVLLK